MGYTELKAIDVEKTRKSRSCEWCAQEIPAGSKAFHRSYIFEGDFNSAYMHPECKNAYGEAPPDIVEDGWIPGDFKRGTWEGA